MALLRQVFKQCDISFLSKHCSVIRKNNWNIEFPFSAKKVDVPSPPKRPLTAYMIFCKENRQELLKENPSLTTPEQIKALAAKWSNLSVVMKEPYEVSARKCTLSYGEEHKKFYENLTEQQKGELARLKAEKRESRRLLKLKRELRESGLPKPAASAYVLFVQSQAKGKTGINSGSDVPFEKPREEEHEYGRYFKFVERAKELASKLTFGDTSSECNRKMAPFRTSSGCHQEIQSVDFIKEAAEKWKTLSEDAKKSFEEQSQADKKRHILEMEKWRARLISEGKFKLLKGYNELKGKGSTDPIPIPKTSQKARKETSSEGKEAKET